MRQFLVTASLVVLALALGATAGYNYALHPPKTETAAAVWYVDVYGTARDEDGKPLAGVEVSAMRGDITYRSMTNDSGEWDVNIPLGPLESKIFTIIPEPRAVTGPCPVILNGNVCEVRVPGQLGTRLGPFRIVYPRPTPMPTITPIPSEPVITQTWTPTRTKTPTRTATASVTPTQAPFITVTPRASPTGTGQLRPGFYPAPPYVQMGIITDFMEMYGIDLTDCMWVAAMDYNLGLPVSELRRGIFCQEEECTEVFYRLWGCGDIALVAPVTDTCLIGMVYVPANGDANWHSKTPMAEAK